MIAFLDEAQYIAQKKRKKCLVFEVKMTSWLQSKKISPFLFSFLLDCRRPVSVRVAYTVSAVRVKLNLSVPICFCKATNWLYLPLFLAICSQPQVIKESNGDEKWPGLKRRCSSEGLGHLP